MSLRGGETGTLVSHRGCDPLLEYPVPQFVSAVPRWRTQPEAKWATVRWPIWVSFCRAGRISLQSSKERRPAM